MSREQKPIDRRSAYETASLSLKSLLGAAKRETGLTEDTEKEIEMLIEVVEKTSERFTDEENYTEAIKNLFKCINFDATPRTHQVIQAFKKEFSGMLDDILKEEEEQKTSLSDGKRSYTPSSHTTHRFRKSSDESSTTGSDSNAKESSPPSSPSRAALVFSAGIFSSSPEEKSEEESESESEATPPPEEEDFTGKQILACSGKQILTYLLNKKENGRKAAFNTPLWHQWFLLELVIPKIARPFRELQPIIPSIEFKILSEICEATSKDHDERISKAIHNPFNYAAKVFDCLARYEIAEKREIEEDLASWLEENIISPMPIKPNDFKEKILILICTFCSRIRKDSFQGDPDGATKAMFEFELDLIELEDQLVKQTFLVKGKNPLIEQLKKIIETARAHIAEITSSRQAPIKSM